MSKPPLLTTHRAATQISAALEHIHTHLGDAEAAFSELTALTDRYLHLPPQAAAYQVLFQRFLDGTRYQIYKLDESIQDELARKEEA